jgi:hypothetical protein
MQQFRSLIEELEARKLLSADLTGSFTGKIPGAISLKSPTKLTVKIADTGAASISGPATLTLFASQDSTLDSNDPHLAVARIKLNLKPGKSTNVTESFNAPVGAGTGSYFLVGDIVPANSAASVFFSSAKVSIISPFVDLAGTVSLSPKTTSFTVGGKAQKPLALTVNVTNHGNVPVKGPVAITVFGSSNTILDPLDTLLTTLPAKTLMLNPGKSKKFTINFKPTAATQSGKFFGIADVNSGTTIRTAVVESNIDNDTSVTSNTFTITNPAKPQRAAFVGGLTDDNSVILVGTPELTTFSATVAHSSATTAVELDEVDSSGNLIGKITNLQDDGSPGDGDAVAGDGTFSGIVPINFDALGTRYFIAKVTDSANGSSGATAAMSIAGVNPPTDAQLQQDDDSANVVAAPAYAIAAAKGTAAQIIAAVQASLQSDADLVPGSVSTTSDSIMWENTDGTLECIPTDILLGNRGASEPVQTLGSASQVATPAALAPATAAPSDQIIRPADDNADGQTAVVLDPYNDQFGTNDLSDVDSGDEAPAISQMLSDAGYQTTYLSTSQISSLTVYQNLGSNAAIVIVSHGAVDPKYGSFLATSVLDSEDPWTSHKFDLANQRLALYPTGEGQQYLAGSQFFARYTGSMDGTIVYLGACHLGETSEMPNAFLDQGAGAVIAYTGVVQGVFAAPHGIAAFKTLVQPMDNTIGDIPGINVDVVTAILNPSVSHVARPNLITSKHTVSPNGLVLTGVVNRFLSFGDLTATLPGKPLLTNVNLIVTYSWPNDEKDLDSKTTFGGGSAGFNLDGGTYLNWLGDQQGAGLQETTIVDLYDAWKAGVFGKTTVVNVGADWYTPDAGAGPATISVALEDIDTEEQYQIQSLIIIPGTETDGATSQQGEISVTLGGDPTNPTVTVKLGHV